MTDNILTKDRDSADIALAAKDIAGIKFPRNVLTDPSGNDITPASETTQQSVQTAVEAIVAALFATGGTYTLGDKGILALGKRRDSDTAMVADGQTGTFNMDEAGRLKVSTQPASYGDTTGNITASAQTVFANVDRASNVSISMVATSLVGHNATFEYSNNSTNGTDGNWYVTQAALSNSNTAVTATGVLAATPAYGWEISVNAYKWVRVRATAHTSGTAAYIIKQGTYATEPVPVIQVTGTQPVSGTVTSNEGTPVTPTGSILNSVAGTNGTVVKGSAGNVYSAVLCNSGAAAAYFKLHNSATVTVGTTAVAMWIKIDAGANVNIQLGSKGLRHTTGICYSITGAAADNDTTAVAAGQVKVNLTYV